MALRKEQTILLSLTHDPIPAQVSHSLIEKTALLCHEILNEPENRACEEVKSNDEGQHQSRKNLRLLVTGSTYIGTPGKSRSDWDTGYNWTRGEEIFQSIVDRIGISRFCPSFDNSVRLDGKLIDVKPNMKRNDSDLVNSFSSMEMEEEKKEEDSFSKCNNNIQQIKEFAEIAQQMVSLLKRDNSFSYTSKIVVLFPALPQLGNYDVEATSHILKTILLKVWAESSDSNERLKPIETVMIPISR